MEAVEDQPTPSAGFPLRMVIRVVFQIFAIGFALYLIWPRLAGFERVGKELAKAEWWQLGVLIGFEAGSLFCYAMLIRQAMTSMGCPVPIGLSQRTTLVGTAVGKTLPGGTTTALAVVVNAFRNAGYDAARATAAIAASGMLSSFVLALLLPVALLTASIGDGKGGADLGVTLAAVAFVGVFALLAFAVGNPEGIGRLSERVSRKIAVGPLRKRLDPVAIGEAVARAVSGVKELTRRPKELFPALGWAAGNWLLDVAALGTVAMTVGQGTPLTGLLLAYVIGQLACAIPLTPGGVGVMESVMIGALTAAGAPLSGATTTVLGWRLVSYWLPILVGYACMPTLPGGRRHHRRHKATS